MRSPASSFFIPAAVKEEIWSGFIPDFHLKVFEAGFVHSSLMFIMTWDAGQLPLLKFNNFTKEKWVFSLIFTAKTGECVLKM